MTWEPAGAFVAETLYLNTASMGLPPHVTREALDRDRAAWAAGRRQPGDYDATVARARDLFAQLVHAPPATVALGHQVAPLVGLIAAAVPDDGEVLVAQGEFTSVTFPFAAHADRGVVVREVPLADLADEIGPATCWVAVAAVQSATGEIADLEAISSAARQHGVRTLVDLTQSAGWLDVDATRFDVTVCGAYKWLLSPRGSAFATIAPDLLQTLRPPAAGWFAGEDVWDSIYGLPLRLAADARRFDVSPAWAAWVGTEASLDFLLQIGVPRLHGHALEVAGAFSEAAELAPTGSAILSLAAAPGGDAEVAAVLARHEVVASHRAGRLRLSFHVHNTADEVRPLGHDLRGLVSGR